MTQIKYITETDYINNKVNELFESSKNRVIQWMNTYDIAIITAFRDTFTDATTACRQAKINKDIEDSYKFSKAENFERNNTLYRNLISYGYGVTTLYGKYIEGTTSEDSVEVGEESFFVVNLNNDKNFYDNIFNLAEVFNQDSFLYKSKDNKNAYLIGTNLGNFPKYGSKELAGAFTSLPSRFMSRIKNAAFAFVNKDNWIIKDKKSDISSDEMNDFSHDYSWQHDERPTFKVRKEERISQEKLISDFHKLNSKNGVTLESIKDISRLAKMSLVGARNAIDKVQI